RAHPGLHPFPTRRSSDLLVGTVAGLGMGALVASDQASSRLFYLVGGSTTRKLLVFDPRTLLLTGSLGVSGTVGRAGSLVRWGQEDRKSTRLNSSHVSISY